MSCLIVMSQKELHRLEHIQRVRRGSLTVTRAAALLGLSRSQVHRLLQAYDENGADGLVSKKRGRPSNRRHSEDFRNLALDLQSIIGRTAPSPSSGVRADQNAAGGRDRSRRDGKRRVWRDREIVKRSAAELHVGLPGV